MAMVFTWYRWLFLEKGTKIASLTHIQKFWKYRINYILDFFHKIFVLHLSITINFKSEEYSVWSHYSQNIQRKEFEICSSVLILQFNLKDGVLGVSETRLGHIPVYRIGQNNHLTQRDEHEKTERQNLKSR